MAQATGTTWTNSIAGSLTQATNTREDLEDVIFLLDPMDTWALSNLDRVEALIGEMLKDDGVRLPGARREALRRQAAERGIAVPDALLD